MTTIFDQVFAVVVGEEGGYSTDPSDPGNWTGGRCGQGRCNGTKYGIAAGSHPDLDIAALTLDGAKTIYRQEYWNLLRADELPAALALLVFDAAVNSGVSRAVKWLQAALRVKVDGIFGRETMAAVKASAGQGATLLAEFQAQRLVFIAGLPTWRTFGLGWARRVSRLPFDALRIAGAK